jgi:hypothetical protein
MNADRRTFWSALLMCRIVSRRDDFPLRPYDSHVCRRPSARPPSVFLCDLCASARDMKRISRRGAEIAEEDREALRNLYSLVAASCRAWFIGTANMQGRLAPRRFSRKISRSANLRVADNRRVKAGQVFLCDLGAFARDIEKPNYRTAKYKSLAKAPRSQRKDSETPRNSCSLVAAIGRARFIGVHRRPIMRSDVR